MQEAYKIGNAQSIGSYQIQSNYFASRCNNGCLAVLADGSADHINGRRSAVLATEACMREFLYMPEEVEIPLFFDAIAAKILRDMRDIIFLGKTPYLSVSFQWIKDGQLHYYSVGRNQVFLFDGKEYHILQGKYGRTKFEKGMTAGMISRGVSQAVTEKEMISYLMRKEHPYEKAQRILCGVKEKNKKRAANATVLLVEGCL